MKFYPPVARGHPLRSQLHSHPSVTPLLLFYWYVMFDDMMITDLNATCPLRCCIYLRCFYCSWRWPHVSVMDSFLIPEPVVFFLLFFLPTGGWSLKHTLTDVCHPVILISTSAAFPGFHSFVCSCMCDCLLVLVCVFICGSLLSAVNICSQPPPLPPIANSICAVKKPWMNSALTGVVNFYLHENSWEGL